MLSQSGQTNVTRYRLLSVGEGTHGSCIAESTTQAMIRVPYCNHTDCIRWAGSIGWQAKDWGHHQEGEQSRMLHM